MCDIRDAIAMRLLFVDGEIWGDMLEPARTHIRIQGAGGSGLIFPGWYYNMSTGGRDDIYLIIESGQCELMIEFISRVGLRDG